MNFPQPGRFGAKKYRLALLAVALFSTAAVVQAQDPDNRPRKTVENSQVNGTTRLENDLTPTTRFGRITPGAVSEFASPSATRFNNLLLEAIDERIGAPYSFGSTGPYTFDCSGFVWSAFHDAGVDFERASARELWNEFPAPAEKDKFKFGTLVFFNGLGHVGIIASDKGFYHASRSHGVTWSPFNDYWLERIDGFRRVLPASDTPAE